MQDILEEIGNMILGILGAGAVCGAMYLCLQENGILEQMIRYYLEAGM